MISTKPIYLSKYLRLKRNKTPLKVGRLFYLSWEDALWDILEKKKVKKNSTVLVPEFFCGDVENNIRNHGYKVAYFPVSKELITTEKQLTISIKKYRPSVIIIFHSIGILNTLLKKPTWLKYLNKRTILFEDCVHRVVDPNKIIFHKTNHFIIDSLRKVVPLQGSVAYAQKNDINFSEPPLFQSFIYATSVTLLWFVMNIFWSLTQIFNQVKLSIWFSNCANYFMKVGYDLIGDNAKPARGFFLFNFLQQYLDIRKIKLVKRKQVEFYEKKLKFLSENFFQKVPYDDKEKGELIAYPFILPIKIAQKIKRKIKGEGLLLDFELNDSKWSKKQKIIYLPLGLHISESQLGRISEIINQLGLSYS